MTVAHIWIIVPIMVAMILFVMNRFVLFNYFVATALTLALSMLAWGVQPNVPINLGLTQVIIREDFIIAGRVFHIDKGLLNIIGIVNLGALLWFGGSWFVKKAKNFYAVNLAIIGLLTAAMSINPFLYAALLYELVVIISVPLYFYRSWQTLDLSVSRYLAYQTIGYMLLLLSGWGLNAVDPLQPDIVLVNTTVVLFWAAFSILMALFPFYTWLSSLVSAENLYAVSFITTLVIAFFVVIAGKFYDTNILQLSTLNPLDFFRFMGIVTMLVASLAILFEQKLIRVFVFLIALLASKVVILLSFKASLDSLLLSLMLGGFSLALFALAFNTLQKSEDESGLPPISKVGLIVGSAGLIGVPLIGDFRGVIEIEDLLLTNETFVSLFVFAQVVLYLGWARLLVRVLTGSRLSLRNDTKYANANNVSQLIVLTGITAMIFMVNIPKLMIKVIQWLLVVGT